MNKILLFLLLMCYNICFANETKYINDFISLNVINNKPLYQKSTNKYRHYTPYYVDYDYRNDKCTIYHTPYSKKFNKKLLKFALYHEAAHCVLYEQEIFFKDKTDLYNLVMADSMLYNEERVVGYMYFHELFADALAIALILKENSDSNILEKVKSFRNNSTSIKAPHQTIALLNQLKNENWKQMDVVSIKKRVLYLVENQFENTWINKFFKENVEKKQIPEITKSFINSFWLIQNNQDILLPKEKDYYKIILNSFSDKMNDKKYTLIKNMYQYKSLKKEDYLRLVCSNNVC